MAALTLGAPPHVVNNGEKILQIKSKLHQLICNTDAAFNKFFLAISSEIQ